MPLVNLTTAGIKKVFFFIFSSFLCLLSFAQENSPYSRYGLGDVVPSQNMVSRSMGGISAGYSDFRPKLPLRGNRDINFVNPASLANITHASFDIGVEVDRRTLKSNTSPEKYNATNVLVSYLQFGVPLTSKKMAAKDMSWAMSLGLRPVTRINYVIEENKRIPGVDSSNTLYEGDGGLNQASVSTALRIKNLSFGISGGYSFGNKDYSTRRSLINDSVLYYRANAQSNTNFGGIFFTGGIQYEIKTKNGTVRLGAYGNFEQKLKATRSSIVETFSYDGGGGTVTIDTIAYTPEAKGEIIYPATYGIGFTYSSANWIYGADLETTSWDNYRDFGQKDFLQNNWKFRAGAQLLPITTSATSIKYAQTIRYRAGMYYGPDPISIGTNRKEYGFTLGAGLPLTSVPKTLNGEFAMLNAGIEFGGRGNKESISVRETVLKFTFGVSMNARWFVKRKYN